MKLNETLYGFTVTREAAIDEIKATLYEAIHEKSGARLIYLDREDENKTFSITFKTLPEDSTGVFHIIEHSVLNGSEKYPVKEPFVELLKGSLNTFLNAMTFADKTMYPVASRNDKDFLNLVSVYLDAVFHPLMLTEPNIFYQEGWHYELDSRDGELKTSGVVLNEMRGAYSSPDEVSSYHIREMLYGNSCYRFESGGEPGAITDLTHEEFCKAHAKYYHPSNAEIFLDGSVKLDEVLPLIDEYLSEYERKEISFDIPSPVKPKETTREIEYEIAENESPENKTRLSVGYLTGRFDEQEKSVAISVLIDALTSSNESPLKKAIIDSGLCEDLLITTSDSMQDNMFFIDFRNVKDGKCDELYEFFNETVTELCKNGIDKDALEASLNSIEFKLREKDFGTFPIGVIYAMTVEDSTLYGGDAMQNLVYEKVLSSIREKLKGDYFEKLLYSLVIENEYKAKLRMTPSPTLGKRRSEEESARLAAIKAKMTDDEIEELLKFCEDLKAWQEREDTDEALAALPMLKLEDISPKIERIPHTVEKSEGVTTLHADVATSGITYLSLYYDSTDLSADEIFKLRILLSLFEEVKTKKRSAIELQNLIKSNLGALGASAPHLTTRSGEVKLYSLISASFLDSKKEEAVSLIREMIYDSIFTDKEVARNIIRQMKIGSEESFSAMGHSIAFTRSSAQTNPEAAIAEYYSGYEAHLSTKRLDKSFDELADGLIKSLEALVEKIFVRERLTIVITGRKSDELTKTIVDMTPSGCACATATTPVLPLGRKREGILIPARAAFAGIGAYITDLGEDATGSIEVARSLLSYDFLWNKVRVQGGAYGVGLIARNENVGFYSYRDPSPKRSVGCFAESGEFLRDLAKSGEDITKFIIGAVGNIAPLLTPKLKGSLAARRYLRGVTDEETEKRLGEILATDSDALINISKILDKICESACPCIIAGRDILDACNLDSILEI